MATTKRPASSGDSENDFSAYRLLILNEIERLDKEYHRLLELLDRDREAAIKKIERGDKANLDKIVDEVRLLYKNISDKAIALEAKISSLRTELETKLTEAKKEGGEGGVGMKATAGISAGGAGAIYAIIEFLKWIFESAPPGAGG